VVHDRILIVRLVESLVTLYITKITKVLIIARLLVDLGWEADVDMRGFFVFLLEVGNPNLNDYCLLDRFMYNHFGRVWN